jgi:2,5-furandicarboxylate decarboxylase 1
MLWNRDIIGKLFGISKEKIPFVIAKAIGDWQKNKDKLSSPILMKGPANEVIEEDVNLFKLPIPVHALKDGGRYFDSSVVVVKNPTTGVPNTSIHRMMATKKDRLTFLIDPDRHLVPIY